MAEGQPPLSLYTTAAVAAAAGALGFAIVYSATAERAPAENPASAEPLAAGNGQQAKRSWSFRWPFTTRTASQQAGA